VEWKTFTDFYYWCNRKSARII